MLCRRLHLRWILLGLPVPRAGAGSVPRLGIVDHRTRNGASDKSKILSRGSREGVWVVGWWRSMGRTPGCPMARKRSGSLVGASRPRSGMVGGSGTLPRLYPDYAPATPLRPAGSLPRPVAPLGLSGRSPPPEPAPGPQQPATASEPGNRPQMPGARPRSPAARCNPPAVTAPSSPSPVTRHPLPML